MDLEHERPEQEVDLPTDIQISPGNDGIQALRTLVNSIADQPQSKETPIVFGTRSATDTTI